MLNKSYATNAVALSLIALSYTLPEQTLSEVVLFAGLFAFSGAITNVLAVHMLFEKVPLLYGSGVIVNRFDAFKEAIRKMMMEQFFTKVQLDDFFAKEEQKIELVPLIEKTDFTPAYDALSTTVMESPFGGMLGMFGGEKALEGLREPFTGKLKSAVVKIVQSDTFNQQLQSMLQGSTLSDDVRANVEGLIEQRLDELTPQMVKELVSQLIREHLQWLVVWGGVFGGVIGMTSALLF